MGKVKKSHVFDSWGSFLERARGRHINGSSCRGDREFTETDTWDEAYRMAETGWESAIAGAELVSAHVESQVHLERHEIGFQATYDVAGAEVDMDRYLMGEPECMIESMPLKVSRAGRAVRLVVPIGFLAHVKTRQTLARGSAILALVDALRQAQHPLEIWAVSHCTRPNAPGNWALAVKVQDATQPVDIGSLSFALAHPSMLRRLVFGCREQDAGFDDHGGMGGTVELTDEVIELLPPAHGTEIRLPTLQASDDWSEDASARWIEAQLARIFD